MHRGHAIIAISFLCHAMWTTAPCQAAIPLADRVVIIKKEKVLILLSKGEVLKTYKVALGRDPVGPKSRQGDGKTPEGVYVVDRRDSTSKFHKALHISYPNPADVARAQRYGVSPGRDIMIHGLPNGFDELGEYHSERNWTKGCVAVNNAEIDEIWRLVPDGTPVEIRP